ncbi:MULTISPECIES: glycosyltransferase family 4 protein [Microbacterium]|uniref:glycosyltransferase family 4 protein n=1 Tax=Microbacterium TaxID=33882 RepID=UPI00344B58FE
MATAAARTHDVWVITRPRFRQAIEGALSTDAALRSHLHVAYLDLPPGIVRLKRRGVDLYWYYALWQQALGRRARALHANVGFDVAHHVTFANDWMPCGLTALRDVPLVWGPVGGSSTLPIRRLRPWLGARGTLTELVRALSTGLFRRLWGAPAARRAALVVAQNPDVAGVFRRTSSAVVVEPNACLDDLPTRAAAEVRPRHAVFAGRLLAWKGAALAIEALARPEAADWTLTIFGDGYERARLEGLTRRLGLGARVEFAGHRPRPEVLEAIARAEVFLFPSMHDQAGWVVAEASTMGCPVVCLPLGGPPTLAERNAHVASLDGDIPASLARRLVEAAARGGEPHDRWSARRLPDLVAGWYHDALRPGRGRAPIRVLETFGVPKPTTNPYISQLHTSLRATDDLEVLTFDYRTALLGRYDVVHAHWPELMVDGHRAIGRWSRRALAALTVLRWRITRTPVVRTVHNLERPQGISRFDHAVLSGIDAATTLDIALNDRTPLREGVPQTVIPHGHYRDWFAAHPDPAAVPGRVAYVGLIRRYKGVEDLIDAFTQWDEPSVSLHIAGRPTSPDLAAALQTAAASDGRISIDPRFLDDADFVSSIRSAELIVLPYRHMHNSGTALAALSLDRPVLVPDNAVNRALAKECGPRWVHLFQDSITAADIERAWKESRSVSGAPDLSRREWAAAGVHHLEAFRRVVPGRS